MSLVPGVGKDGEAPPHQSGPVWFQRSCVGLAFALWSAALTVPLASFQNWFDAKPFQADRIYPLGTDSAPGILSFMVGGTFVAIVLGAVDAGMRAADSVAGWISDIGALWFIAASFATVIMVASGSRGPGHFTPLAGMWLIWVANGLVAVSDIPAANAAKAAAADRMKQQEK